MTNVKEASAAVVAKDFPWDEKSLQAVAWFAEGRYSAVDVAAYVGTPIATVRTWRNNREFRAAIASLQEQYMEQAAEVGLQRKTARVARVEQRMDGIAQVFEERGASASEDKAEELGIAFDPYLAMAPGGTTGLVIHRTKVVGAGLNSQVIEEFEIDTQAIRLEADLSKQLAVELGQWTEKSETTHVKKLYINVNIDDV